MHGIYSATRTSKMKSPGLVFLVSLAAILSVSQCTEFEDELEGLFEQQEGYFLGHKLGRRENNANSDISSDNNEFNGEEPEDLGPCAGTPKCRGLFQVPIPPSCKCACPSDSNKDCTPQEVFDDNICECICRDININCPGKSDFNFDVCNCVCPLHEEDCGSGKRLNPSGCVCVEKTTLPTGSTPAPQPPAPNCPSDAAWKCKRDTQYLDSRTCSCVCRRYLVKKSYHNGYYQRYHRYGRYPYYGRGFHGDGEDEESRRRRSSGGSDSDSGGEKTQSRSESGNDGDDARRPEFPAQQPLYALTCPVGKRVDHKSCLCYW